MSFRLDTDMIEDEIADVLFNCPASQVDWRSFWKQPLADEIWKRNCDKCQELVDIDNGVSDSEFCRIFDHFNWKVIDELIDAFTS